jgi:hypothetical protein
VHLGPSWLVEVERLEPQGDVGRALLVAEPGKFAPETSTSESSAGQNENVLRLSPVPEWWVGEHYSRADEVIEQG